MLRLFHRFNRVARHRNSDLHLLLDNCSSHLWAAKILDPNGSQETSFVYDRIVIVFFPPNATSDCQPLDQGIIRSVKAGFRRAQLRTLLAEYELWQAGKHEGDCGKFPINDHTHIRNGMCWLKEAWNNLSENTIRRCFAKSKCLPLDSQAELNSQVTRRSAHVSNNDGDVNDLMEMLQRVRMDNEFAQDMGLKEGETNVVINELITFDNNDPTGSDCINDEEIISLAMESSGISPADLAVDDDDEAVEVSIGTAISSCRNLRSFLSMSHIRNTDLITMISQYETVLVKEQRLLKQSRLVQPTMLSFLHKDIGPSSRVATSSALSLFETTETSTDFSPSFVLPSTWEEMNQLYHAYNCEGHGKGSQKTVKSMTQCGEHLRAWVRHVSPETDGVGIADVHIKRIENELKKDLCEKYNLQ